MKIIIVSVLLITNILFSQEDSNKYLPDDLDALEAYLEKINDHHLNNISGEFSSEIKKILKNRDEKIFNSIKDSNYVFNPEINKNLDFILHEIYKANPEIDTSNYSFFIKNAIDPNAACYGNGMFEINLGLFTLLETDDELTFVICHEIAHKLLEHNIKNISNRVATINSKETKEKVSSLRRLKYGQTRAALSVIDELNINMLDYSKEVEAQADSLGFILFSKTNYNKFQATSSLRKLDFKDDVILNFDVKIDSVFNFESYPFQAFWLKQSTAIFDTSEKINEFKLASDTIKSHPEIDYRIDKLLREFNIDSMNSSGTYRYLKEIKNIAQIKSIEYTIDLKFLDLSIYQLIQKHSNELISSEYYVTAMSEVLRSIYMAKKNHELGKYVPRSNNFSDDKQLNTIRVFLHNLELDEVRKIGLSFCETNKNKVPNNPLFESNLEFFKNN